MDRIVISGVQGFDGEYDLDPERAFNAREWRWIKKLSGYLPDTINDGYRHSDPDLFVAFAVIAMCRDGKIGRDDWQRVGDELAEVPLDGATLKLVGDPVEDDSPLALTSTPNDISQNGVLAEPKRTGQTEKPSGKSSSPSLV